MEGLWSIKKRNQPIQQRISTPFEVQPMELQPAFDYFIYVTLRRVMLSLRERAMWRRYKRLFRLASALLRGTDGLPHFVQLSIPV